MVSAHSFAAPTSCDVKLKSGDVIGDLNFDVTRPKAKRHPRTSTKGLCNASQAGGGF